MYDGIGATNTPHQRSLGGTSQHNVGLMKCTMGSGLVREAFSLSNWRD